MSLSGRFSAPASRRVLLTEGTRSGSPVGTAEPSRPQGNTWIMAILAGACFWVISSVQAIIQGDELLPGDKLGGVPVTDASTGWLLAGLGAALLLPVLMRGRVGPQSAASVRPWRARAKPRPGIGCCQSRTQERTRASRRRRLLAVHQRRSSFFKLVESLHKAPFSFPVLFHHSRRRSANEVFIG